MSVITEETAPALLSGPDLGSVPGLSPWRREAREAAWRSFEALPAPTRKNEEWRFSSLKSLDLTKYTSPQPVSSSKAEELIARSTSLDETSGRMIFGNDQLLAREYRSDALRAQGVLWLPLEQAATEYPELFRKYFMRSEAALGSQKYAALHEAWAGNGTFLYVPRGVEMSLPIEAFHWLDGANASCFPHTLIVAEENSSVTFVDYFQSSDSEATGFACGVNDLWVGAGARLHYAAVQRWSNKTLSIQINSTSASRDSSAVALSANLGGGYTRSESISQLREPGSRSDMLSLAMLNGTQELDQRTLQIHEVPHTASDLLYKNVLDDHTRSIFSGLIRVVPHAHFTDAYQKVRNLLLSDDCEANSAPGLEIEADNVRCTHGATCGQIEGEELFYLLSRGIPIKSAQRLIVQGFLNEALTRFPNEAIQHAIRELLISAI